ncbi:hypothetical protein BD324DRAFT_622870 [Kockovaella imperatae]|uniref:Uncharacterized protein n=1 Tax=Kockovaella imperatae TaxID=4999 RepID=A0A1Y1UI83_9TREE|nr:hypothetical protein BD324DRAFT_622870 [Kockovaella imperatae]ORX37689.1 hypothetical protein BD324DRAFT_622870 [Kockovaella imperatae]
MEDQPEASGSSSRAARPSSNEVRLGRRVLELEHERDTLLAEIRDLRSRRSSEGASSSSLAAQTSSQPRMAIPDELLPTLTLLRNHIRDLTRDNEALRYTFVGISSNPSALNERDAGPSRSLVDLGEVVVRVRELMQENEELGQMIIEAGRSSDEEWQKLIADARKVIESLESDLEQHANIVESQRAEIDRYKAEIESLRSPASSSSRPRFSGGSSYSPLSHDMGTEYGSSSSHVHGQGRNQRSMTNESRNSNRSKDGRPSSGHGSRGNMNRRQDGDRERDKDRSGPRDKGRSSDRRQSNTGNTQRQIGQNPRVGPSETRDEQDGLESELRGLNIRDAQSKPAPQQPKRTRGPGQS